MIPYVNNHLTKDTEDLSDVGIRRTINIQCIESEINLIKGRKFNYYQYECLNKEDTQINNPSVKVVYKSKHLACFTAQEKLECPVKFTVIYYSKTWPGRYYLNHLTYDLLYEPLKYYYNRKLYDYRIYAVIFKRESMLNEIEIVGIKRVMIKHLLWLPLDLINIICTFLL